MNTTLAEHAVRLSQELNAPVFPVRVYPDPDSPGKTKKQPLVKAWQNGGAALDPDTIRSLFGRHSNAATHVGVQTGNGLVLIDIDTPEALAWVRANPQLFPATREQPTHRQDGLHLFLSVPLGVHVRTSVGEVAPGIDIRGDGGFACDWSNEHEPNRRPIASAPPALLELIGIGASKVALPEQPDPTPSSPAGEGTRNNALFRLGLKLRGANLATEDELLATLSSFNQTRCNPPLPADEVRRIAASLPRYAGIPQAAPLLVAATAQAKSELPPVFTMPREWFNRRPAPLDHVIEGYVPMGKVSLLAAEGGTGKSSLLLGAATHVALGSSHYAGLVLHGGPVLYCSLEDGADEIERRLSAICEALRFSLVLKVTRGELTVVEARRAEEEYRTLMAENFHIWPLSGKQLHLIGTNKGGAIVQERGVEELLEQASRIAGLRWIIADPLARLHGTDENSNAVGTALINAADRVVNGTGAAFMLAHHSSKQSAKDRDMTAAAVRGGSALSDGARSVLRLAPVDKEETGVQLVDVHGELLSGKHYAEGRVRLLAHAKCNYARQQPNLYLLRAEDSSLLEPLTIAQWAGGSTVDARQKFAAWAAQMPSDLLLTKKKVREVCKDMDLTRDAALAEFQAGIDRGEWGVDHSYKFRNPTAAAYRRIAADTGEIPFAPIAPAKETPLSPSIAAKGFSSIDRRYVLAAIENLPTDESEEDGSV